MHSLKHLILYRWSNDQTMIRRIAVSRNSYAMYPISDLLSAFWFIFFPYTSLSGICLSMKAVLYFPSDNLNRNHSPHDLIHCISYLRIIHWTWCANIAKWCCVWWGKNSLFLAFSVAAQNRTACLDSVQ